MPNIRKMMMATAGASGGGIGTVGELWSWGNNARGQLGVGDTTHRCSPVQIGSSTDWKEVSSGGKPGKGGCFAIKEDYSLFAWGYNGFGRLGLGDTTDRSSPVQVGSLTDWKSAAFGFEAAFFVKTDGTLWAVGRNNYGQLGVGDTTDRSSPVQIGSLTTWRTVMGSRAQTSAIKTDGTLWMWGYGGVVFAGSSLSSPVQIGSDTNWANLDAGQQSVTASKTDGKLFAWGQGDKGRSDHGNTTTYSSPVQVGSDTDWNADTTQYTGQASGEKQGHALKTDGTIWGWGENENGELGAGDTTDRSSPVQFGGESTWTKLHSKYRHTLAINDSNELWACGRNSDGCIGDGTGTNRSSPVQIGSLTTWIKARAGPQNSLAIKDPS